MQNPKLLKLKRKFRRNKRQIGITAFVLFACIVVAGVGLSFFYTSGSFSGTSSTITIPEYAPIINGSKNMNQNINLSNTITNNKRLAPGAVGKFKVDLDFSSVDSDAYYKVYFDRTNIPNNIHFYVDKDLSSELFSIEGVQLLENSNKTAEHYIYWTWEYSDTTESNENDSLYMNQEINLPFVAYVSQNVERHTVIVNDQEKPTGRINISGTQGSFNINLDFSNFDSSKNYKVYFNSDDVSSGLHFYTDSSYQNEITNINGTYNGSDSSINNTIYWKYDGGSLNTSLYYVVNLS